MSRGQRLTLVATILGSTVVFLDATVVNVAFPRSATTSTPASPASSG